MHNRTITRRRRLGSGHQDQQPLIRDRSPPKSQFFASGLPQQTVSLIQETWPSNQSRSGQQSYDATSAFASGYDYSGSGFSDTQNPVYDIIISDMPCVERTTEFRTVCKSLHMKAQANGFHPTKKANTKDLVDETMQFNKLAKKIGRDLSQTCAKLEKLAILAKRKSLFDDRMGEIDELTSIVKQDIAGLNGQIAQLQHYLSERQGGVMRNGNQNQNHSKSVVVCLQSKLASMSNDFKQVLEVRTENLKHQHSRREKFGHNQPIPSSLPPSASSGHLGSVLLNDDHMARTSSNGSVVLDMNEMGQARMQQQTQLIADQNSYIQSRTETMENIESTIVELGQIFSQLAHMVQEQGEMVHRIDSNVEEATLNVEAAHMELLRYFRSISSNRWLALKVFLTIIIFFIIFIVFLA